MKTKILTVLLAFIVMFAGHSCNEMDVEMPGPPLSSILATRIDVTMYGSTEKPSFSVKMAYSDNHLLDKIEHSDEGDILFEYEGENVTKMTARDWNIALAYDSNHRINKITVYKYNYGRPETIVKNCVFDEGSNGYMCSYVLSSKETLVNHFYMNSLGDIVKARQEIVLVGGAIERVNYDYSFGYSENAFGPLYSCKTPVSLLFVMVDFWLFASYYNLNYLTRFPLKGLYDSHGERIMQTSLDEARRLSKSVLQIGSVTETAEVFY